jgi:hypothetical protein
MATTGTNPVQDYGTYGKYLFNHWLIAGKAFEQGIKKDPQLSLLYSRFMKEGGIGQTDIVKLNMGNSHQQWNLSEGGSFAGATEAGKTDFVDSSTIPNQSIASRIMMTGHEMRALENGGEKVIGASLPVLTKNFATSFTNNLLRQFAGDGTGALCYCTGGTNTLTLQDWDGTTLASDHWVWKFLYTKMNIDVVTWATGALGNASDTCLSITAITPTSGTITTDDITGTYSSAKTTVLCFYQPRRTSTVYQVEVAGLRSMVYAGNTVDSSATVSYLGKSAATYPNWTSPLIDCSAESLDVRKFDRAIYASTGNPDVAIFDTASMSQFRYEADQMKKLSIKDDMVLGQPRAIYMGPKGPITLIDSTFLTGQKAGYLLQTDTFRVKGTVMEPRSMRGGKMQLLEGTDYWVDDYISEFENICVDRGANVKLYNLKTAW